MLMVKGHTLRISLCLLVGALTISANNDDAQQKIDRLYRSARLAAERQDYLEALLLTDQIEAEAGTNYRLLMFKAELLFDAGLSRPAAKSAEEAIVYAKTNPERARAALKVASVFSRHVHDLRRKDTPSCEEIEPMAKAAGRWYNKANEFDTSKGLRSLAWTLQIRGQFAAAQEALRQHIQQVPEDLSGTWLLEAWSKTTPEKPGECLLGAVPLDQPFPRRAVRRARRRGLDEVEVGGIVGPDGSVRQIAVFGSVPEEVAARFRDVYAAWKLEPAIWGGNPVQYPFVVTFPTKKQWPVIIWNSQR